MRPFEEKSYFNWPSRTRSGKGYGRALQLSGDTKEKNGVGLMPLDRTITDDSVISVHDGQTQVETIGVGTQVLDAFTDSFGSELDDAICDTQVLDDPEDTCQAQRGSLEGEMDVSEEYNNENDTVFEDMEGDTQKLDYPEDMSQNQLPNFGTHLGRNESGYCKENFSTQILDDQLCTEDLVTTSDGWVTVSNGGIGNSSSKEMDLCKSSSDCLTDGTVDYTSGRPPLRFTEIRVESWIAHGLEIKKRALSANTIGAVCSAGTSPANQNHVDKVNDNSVKGSSSNMEGTDDENFTLFTEPEVREFGNERKVKSSAIRKLFSEESVPQTEACGIISTGNDESEPPAAGGTDAARLSYIESQEPNDLAQAKALDFIEKFLTDNLADIDTNDGGGTRVNNLISVTHSNRKPSLVKKSILRSTVGFSKAFDWDDNNEDEGGGAFFCKLKEKTSKKESQFVKSAPAILKLNPPNSEELDKVTEQPKANGEKRKLTYSDSEIVPQNMKKTAMNGEGNAKENVIKVSNLEHCTGKNASHQNTSDLTIAGKDVTAGTSAIKESHVGFDTYQLHTKEKDPNDFVSMGRTTKGSYRHDMRKRSRPSSDKVSNKSAQSKQVPTGLEEGTSQDDRLIEQPMEIPVCAERTSGSVSCGIRTVLTSEGGSSRIDPGKMEQVEQIKPTRSKVKASSRSNRFQALQMHMKNATPRRSCRLNKVTKLKDSCEQQTSQGSNNCTLEHSGFTNDKEAMHLPLQADASLEGLTSEYSLKRMTGRSTWSNEQLGKKRAFPKCELTSGESEHHSVTKRTTEDLQINGPKRRREHDDKKSFRNINNQVKNSGIMTCTRQTRRASLKNCLNPAETVCDYFVKPIEQPADLDQTKRTRPTSTIGHDPVVVNGRDTSVEVINGDQIYQVHPVEHHMQFEPTSRSKIVGDYMNIARTQLGIPLRRSHQLNGSSTLEDLSVQNVNKQASAGATTEKLSHTDFRTSVKDTAHKLETSPRGRTCIPSTDCVTPTNAVKPSEEASPICMGNEYYKLSCNKNLPRSVLRKEVNSLVTLPRKLTSGLKDSRQRRVMTDVRVLFSRHLDESTLTHQKKILDRLGASLASSLSDATHFIANKFVRTKNMLEAIAIGKPVVTPLWLVSCFETRFHIDEKSYILRDVKKEKEFGFSMPVSLDSARRQPLLQKRRVFITPNTKPGREVIACLVKAVGGQVVERITGSALRGDNIGDSLLILTCEEDFEICEPFMEKGAKVYSSELLLNGIVTQRLEFERYRLFRNCGKRTTRRNGRMMMHK